MKKEVLQLAKEIKEYVVLTGRNAHLQEPALTDSWFGLADLADIGREVLGEDILHGVGTWTSRISNEDIIKIAERLLETEGELSWDFEEKITRAIQYIRRQQMKKAA